MNSLLELVLWGAPAVLLSWGLLLALACVVVFRGSGQTSARWGQRGREAPEQGVRQNRAS